MQYQYVTEKQNYEDYAAGRVILSQAGMTSFPVRLASEIFQRATSSLPNHQRLRLYDPCCGGGYLLTVLGFLHGERLSALYGSDINPTMVNLASDNLALLTSDGLNTRGEALQVMATTYNKPSHHEALDSIEHLKQQLPTPPIKTSTWVADALYPSIPAQSIDLIICDIPYGEVTAWQGQPNNNRLSDLLQAQFDVLIDGGIAVVISDKKQRTTYTGYTRLQQETIGKRRFLILQKT